MLDTSVLDQSTIDENQMEQDQMPTESEAERDKTEDELLQQFHDCFPGLTDDWYNFYDTAFDHNGKSKFILPPPFTPAPLDPTVSWNESRTQGVQIALCKSLKHYCTAVYTVGFVGHTYIDHILIPCYSVSMKHLSNITIWTSLRPTLHPIAPTLHPTYGVTRN